MSRIAIEADLKAQLIKPASDQDFTEGPGTMLRFRSDPSGNLQLDLPDRSLLPPVALASGRRNIRRMKQLVASCGQALTVSSRDRTLLTVRPETHDGSRVQYHWWSCIRWYIAT